MAECHVWLEGLHVEGVWFFVIQTLKFGSVFVYFIEKTALTYDIIILFLNGRRFRAWKYFLLLILKKKKLNKILQSMIPFKFFLNKLLQMK